MKKSYSVSERAALVSEWERSGQTQTEFAHSRGLGLSTLSKWIRNSRPARSTSPAPSLAFSEVRLATHCIDICVARIKVGALVIEILSGATQEDVSCLCRALVAVPS